MDVKEVIEEKKHGRSDKYEQRHFHSGFFVDLGNQVGSSNVDSDSG